MKPLIANKFIQQWAEALNLDPSDCQRVVIDAQVNDVVRVYVSKVGQESLLTIDPPHADEVRIIVAGEKNPA